MLCCLRAGIIFPRGKKWGVAQQSTPITPLLQGFIPPGDHYIPLEGLPGSALPLRWRVQPLCRARPGKMNWCVWWDGSFAGLSTNECSGFMKNQNLINPTLKQNRAIWDHTRCLCKHWPQLARHSSQLWINGEISRQPWCSVTSIFPVILD